MADQRRDNLGRFLSGGKDRSHLNFNDTFADRLGKFLADAPGGGISIYSGYRSPERQAQLYNAAVSKYGSKRAARNWVAPPGKSRHNHGLAADLRYATAAQKEWAHANAKKYGLNFRMKNENWHIEPIDAKELMAVGTPPRPSVDVPNPGVITAQAMGSMPALSYTPDTQDISPVGEPSATGPLGAMTALDAINRAAPSAPLSAIDSVAPIGARENVVGQYVDMSRFAPQAPATPAGPMADASYNFSPEAAMGFGYQDAPQAPTPTRTGITDDDDNISFAMAKSVMPGGIMSPTGPLGGNGLYAKAQDPATFAGAPTGSIPAPVAQAPQAPIGLYTPASMLTNPGVLGAIPTGVGVEPSMPMGLAPPGVGALPQAMVPSAPFGMPPAPPATPPPAYQAPMALPQVAPIGSMPAGDFPARPSMPSYTPSDIYGGQVGSAVAGDGNTVSRDPFGITSVTNKYGVTTGMTPTGKQTAYGGTPGPIGMTSLFGGGPKFSGMPGPRAQRTMGTFAGGALGTMMGGPLGGLIGALAGRMMGNQLSMRSFPGAPLGPAGGSNGVAGGDRTAAERSSRSPAAADHISRGGAVSGLW